jgi:hypothetical protein
MDMDGVRIDKILLSKIERREADSG